MLLVEEKIAELIGMMPLFIGTLLEGSEIKAPVKLNLSEERTLMVLHHEQGKDMTDYSKKVGLTRGSFTAVADLLERKGFIARVAAFEDRRKYALILTEAGKSVAQNIDAQFKEHIANRIAQLEKEELD
ncbi:MAG: MarR family transcriptional regulator, partial [Firmicutes bacterium]|nr:MarR family transcriptional regulator [Bacillota bacterium]